MTEPDPVDEGRRLVQSAREAGIPVRLVGGVAIGLRAPSVSEARPERTYHDIDIAAERATGRELAALLEEHGYTPHRRFNTLAGGRLLFHDERYDRRLDVFLDRIEMCHTLEFRHRLSQDPETLTVADLLLSKLQIVRLTERDVVDLTALLAEHSPSRNGSDLDTEIIESVCCADWGWWRTATGNLQALSERWSAAPPGPGPDPGAAREHAEALLHELEIAPKTLRWKMRSRIGERMAWYQDPEEVR